MLAELLDLESRNEISEIQNIIGYSKREAIYYSHFLHSQNEGYITVATKNKEIFKSHHYKYKNMPSFIGQKNVFLSMNTFSRTYRQVEYLKELNAIYVDIDYYKTKYKFRDVMNYYEELILKNKLPRATVVIRSGRGLYLVWKLEKTPANKLALWQKIENNFASLLIKVGADLNATDVCRVLRAPGTIYQKGNIKTSVDLLDLQPNLVYSLESLSSYVPKVEVSLNTAPKERKEKIKIKRKPSKIAKLFTIRNLNYTRIKDLIQLCKLRNWNMIHYRELTLFLYRYWLLCFDHDAELALEKTLELNEQFVIPLSIREATNATISAEKAFKKWQSEETTLWRHQEMRKGYNYTNERLIELLGISPEEQKQKYSDGNYCFKTIISKDEKYRRKNEKRNSDRRNENGLTSREQEKLDKIIAVKELREKGLTQAEIASKLQIRQGTVSKYLRY